MEVIEIFGVEFVPKSEHEWLEALRGKAIEAFDEACADPCEDDALFDDVRFEAIEDTILACVNGDMFRHEGKAEDAAVDMIRERVGI